MPTLSLQCWNLECKLTDRALPAQDRVAIVERQVKAHGRSAVGIDIDPPGVDLTFVHGTGSDRPDLTQRRLDRPRCLASPPPDVLEESQQGILSNFLEQ